MILQSLIYGSAFYNMPLNGSGGFLRGGALFGAIFVGFFVCSLLISF